MEDAGLAEQARNNTKVDFSNSTALQVVLENALWSHETASAEVLAAIRKLKPRQLVELVLDFGLCKRVRERPTG